MERDFALEVLGVWGISEGGGGEGGGLILVRLVGRQGGREGG